MCTSYVYMCTRRQELLASLARGQLPYEADKVRHPHMQMHTRPAAYVYAHTASSICIYTYRQLPYEADKVRHPHMHTHTHAHTHIYIYAHIMHTRQAKHEAMSPAQRKELATVALLMGSVAGAISSVKPAGEIVDEMVEGAIKVMRSNATMLVSKL